MRLRCTLVDPGQRQGVAGAPSRVAIERSWSRSEWGGGLRATVDGAASCAGDWIDTGNWGGVVRAEG